MTARFSSTDYYELLLLSETFTKDELEDSYAKMRALHSGGEGGGMLAQVEDAYHTLSDPELRKEYDSWLIEMDIHKKREQNGNGGGDIFIPESHGGDIFFQGLADFEEHKLEEAALRFQLALDKQPDFHAARCMLGRVMVKLGGPGASEGRRLIKRALDAEPSIGILIPPDETEITKVPDSPVGDPGGELQPKAAAPECYCVAASTGDVIFATWDGALTTLKRRRAGTTETLAANLPHRALSLECSADGESIAVEARTDEGKGLFALEDGALKRLN